LLRGWTISLLVVSLTTTRSVLALPLGDPTFSVRISARAERDLLRLPERIGAACVEFIFGPLAGTPLRVGGLLSGQLTGLRSARRGSYRIICAVDEELERVDVVHIDHRGDVYR
jgi:mRNA interferase RelE/StbE